MYVITWNMQGAKGGTGSSFDMKKASTRYESKWVDNITSIMKSNQVGVMMLQEVGSLPPLAVPINQPVKWATNYAPPNGMAFGVYQWNVGSSTRMFIVNILWILCDTGASRNNLAIVWNNDLTASNYYFINNTMDGRPAIGVTLTKNSNTMNFFTLHAFSGNGNDAQGLVTGAAAASGAGSTNIPYFMAGDFNRDPKNAYVPTGAFLCNHDEVSTHPGSDTNLDYAICSSTEVNGTVLKEYVASDHLPVMYNI